MIWRKLILLPLYILGTTVVVLPFFAVFDTAYRLDIFILSTAWFAVIHSYLYALYRELLNNA